MYTVKSVSDEGVYYLVNRWNIHNRFWVTGDELKRAMLFRRKQDAKASLTKLLKVMDDYKNDKFEVIEISLNNKTR